MLLLILYHYRYYVGQIVVLMFTDIDMVRQVLVKDFQFFADRRVRTLIVLDMISQHMLSFFLKGKTQGIV